MIVLGRPIVWAWIWGAAVVAAGGFAAWQASRARAPIVEFIEWIIALAMTVGVGLLGMTFGFIAAAPLLRRGRWLFGVLALVFCLACGVFLSQFIGSMIPIRTAGIAAKERTIFGTLLSFKRRSNDIGTTQ